jgi:DNA invertase Pin-like site-specific DNA recombinase
MSLRYAVYARKSQEDEGRQVQSIENQLEENERFATREGLAIVETIFESKSAWEPDNRPEFARLIKMVERGEIDGIVAWHPDRLSRNETDGATLTRLLRQGKLKDLRFASYHFVNSPEGIMMLQIALSQSQYQNSKMAVDVRRGLQKKRADGWFPHRAPEGYLNDLRTHTIVPDPERFPLIREAWDLLLAGDSTVVAVIDTLNSRGYRTLKREKCGGGPLSRSSGYGIFTNPFYTGRFFDRGILHRGQHVPMISEEEFERAQGLIRRHGRPAGRKLDHPYSGLIKCRKCGWGATTELQRGSHRSGEYFYIHCSNRKCCRRSARQDRFDLQVESLLRRIYLDEEAVREAVQELRRWGEGRDEDATAVPNASESAIAETKSHIARLLDLLVRGILDEESYVAKRRSLENQLRDLQRSVRESEHASRRLRDSVENGLQFAAVALSLFQTGTAAIRRKVVDTLGVACWIDEGKIEVKLHPLFQCIIHLRKVYTEPAKMASESTKKDHFRGPVLLGWGSTTLSELLASALEGPPIADIGSLLEAENVASERRGGNEGENKRNVQP